MKRRTLLVALVAGIVGVGFALPYLVYATDYAGEYSVTVKFDVSSPVLYEATVTEVETTSELMNTMSFWSVLLRGHSEETANFTAYVSLNQSGVISTQSKAAILYPFDYNTESMSFTFFEMQPGEITMRIFVQHTYLKTITFDQTWEVLVG